MKTLNLGVVMEQGTDFNVIIGVKGVGGPIDLTGYSFLGEMRSTTDPSSPIAGGVKATGAITFSANPAPLDTVIVNGTIITFVAATPGPNEVLIASTVQCTAFNLKQFLTFSVDPNISKATYAISNSMFVITATFGVAGIIGNAFTLATVSPALTVSGPTLLGGVEPAEFLFTILNQATNKGQVKWFLPVATVNTIGASVSNQLQTKRLKTPYVFDIKMEDTLGTVTRIIQGIIYFSPQATPENFP